MECSSVVSRLLHSGSIGLPGLSLRPFITAMSGPNRLDADDLTLIMRYSQIKHGTETVVVTADRLQSIHSR